VLFLGHAVLSLEDFNLLLNRDSAGVTVSLRILLNNGHDGGCLRDLVYLFLKRVFLLHAVSEVHGDASVNTILSLLRVLLLFVPRSHHFVDAFVDFFSIEGTRASLQAFF